jgi:hypothetical protein
MKIIKASLGYFVISRVGECFLPIATIEKIASVKLLIERDKLKWIKNGHEYYICLTGRIKPIYDIPFVLRSELGETLLSENVVAQILLSCPQRYEQFKIVGIRVFLHSLADYKHEMTTPTAFFV